MWKEEEEKRALATLTSWRLPNPRTESSDQPPFSRAFLAHLVVPSHWPRPPSRDRRLSPTSSTHSSPALSGRTSVAVLEQHLQKILSHDKSPYVCSSFSSHAA